MNKTDRQIVDAQRAGDQIRPHWAATIPRPDLRRLCGAGLCRQWEQVPVQRPGPAVPVDRFAAAATPLLR